MKTNKFRRFLPLILVLVLIAALAVTGIYASLVDSTAVLKNRFSSASITVYVSDQLTVINNGSIPALTRVKLIVNWVDESGNILAVPPEGASYSWTDGYHWTHLGDAKDPADGFWYYNEVLAPSGISYPVISGLNVQGGKIEVKVLADAVQATPAEAAAELWPEAAYADSKWTEN